MSKNSVVMNENFLGAMTLPTTANGGKWLIDDTSSSGTPTYAVGSDGAVLTLASTNEIENVCLHYGDNLSHDIDLTSTFECLVKTVASLDSATEIVIGMGSARADDPDSIAAAALFKLDGSNSIVVESDDGTNNNDDVATGKTLVAAWQRLAIDFSNTADVKFFVNGDRVAQATTFDMSGYTGGLQPIFQISKTADTNTDSLSIRYCNVYGSQVGVS